MIQVSDQGKIDFLFKVKSIEGLKVIQNVMFI